MRSILLLLSALAWSTGAVASDDQPPADDDTVLDATVHSVQVRGTAPRRLSVKTLLSSSETREIRERAVVRSFRPLTEEEKESFRITRLHVVRAQAGETLATLSARTGNALPLGTTAVLNDAFIDSRLREGQPLKIGLSEPYVPRAAPERPVQRVPPDA